MQTAVSPPSTLYGLDLRTTSVYKDCDLYRRPERCFQNGQYFVADKRTPILLSYTDKRHITHDIVVSEHPQIIDKCALRNIQLKLFFFKTKLFKVVEPITSVIAAENDKAGIVNSANVAETRTRRLPV
ncbi:hypothetical protein PsorP6_006445 [Peronosclerospora sorghi]|uniref:Uncharacterized protein n=1 Tax=Peronosclerospora sorghi TaxID=230839 RepID=A0ACC0W4W8_9STRA|nr:hypothetical protein PsorP6_006445 [Peronosclerospora sorghi]